MTLGKHRMTRQITRHDGGSEQHYHDWTQHQQQEHSTLVARLSTADRSVWGEVREAIKHTYNTSQRSWKRRLIGWLVRVGLNDCARRFVSSKADRSEEMGRQNIK